MRKLMSVALLALVLNTPAIAQDDGYSEHEYEGPTNSDQKERLLTQPELDSGYADGTADPDYRTNEGRYGRDYRRDEYYSDEGHR